MKKLFLFSFVLSLTLLIASCSSCGGRRHEKTRNDSIAEFRATLTKEDTTEMLKLTDDAMKMLKNKQYDKVLAMMYEYHDSTKEIKPLTKETARRYNRMFHMFPVIDYERNYYSFQLEGCNDVKYTVIWAPAEKTGTGVPAKTAYMFNPVKVDGSWKLCVKTAEDRIDETLN